MVKRRRRDVYGNWVWEDEEEIKTGEKKSSTKKESIFPKPADSENARDDVDNLKLDWKDFVALSIASLETFLLPIVVFILVLIGILIGLSFLH